MLVGTFPLPVSRSERSYGTMTHVHAGVRSIDDRRTRAEQRTKVIDLVGVRSDWDAFVRLAPHGDIVQTSMWGLSKKAIGQPAVLIEMRGDDGTIIGGALMIERRLAPGIRVGYIARGPVVRNGELPILRTVLETVVSFARERRLRGIIVQLPEGDSGREYVVEEAGFAPGSFPVAPEATIRLDVTLPDDVLLSGMSPERRSNVRKSQKEGIEIAHSDDVATFHRLHLATSDRQGFSALSLEYLEAQWHALAPSGALSILLAFCDGQAVAGKWVSRFGNVVTSRLSGWNAAAAGKRHVNEALHWSGIQWTRAIGARTYDLSGFDRRTAELVLHGLPLPADFAKTHNFFKLGFNSVPTLLPKAHFLLLNRVTNRFARMVGPTLLRGSAVRRLAQRLRSG